MTEEVGHGILELTMLCANPKTPVLNAHKWQHPAFKEYYPRARA